MYNSALWSHYPFSNAEGLYVDGQRRIKPMRELKDGGEGSPSSREDLGGKWPKSQGLHSGRPEKEEQGLEVTQVAGASVCSGGWGPKSQVGVSLWPWSTTLQ